MLDAVHHILDARSLSAPDGRPLYAYKASDAEFKRLEGEVRNDVREHRYLRRTAAAAFCLYGAEHFSRGDGSDWVTYDGVKAALSLDLPDQDLRDAINEGLKFWKRRVLLGGRGREYLATLVCEGGLPQALLRTEGGRLRRYFRDLLEQHETYPHLDVRRMAVDLGGILPVRMQNLVVYELAVALIRHVAALRAPGADKDAVARWPTPLRLDSEAARDLLEGLQTAPRANLRREVGIRVNTTLVRGAEMVLRRDLVLPRQVSQNWLRQALGTEGDLPARLYVSVGTSDGARQAVGVATLQGDEYLLRPTSARPVVSPTVVTEQLLCIVSFAGADVGSFVPTGGEALCEAPWTFDDADGDARLRATGNWQGAAASLLIAVAAEGAYSVDGEVEQLGDILGLRRAVVRVRGPFRWIDDWDEVRVTPASTGVEDRSFELRGARAPSVIHEADAWVGRPNVVEIDAKGILRHVPVVSLVWRPLRGEWTPDLRRAVGLGELAVRRGGEIEFRARLRVLPPDFMLSLRCGGADRGTLRVSGSGLVDVGIVPAPGLSFNGSNSNGGFEIDLVAHDRIAVPATVEVRLRTSVGPEISVAVPFPVETLSLVDRNGRALANNESISLDGLAHVRAVAISPRRASWAVDLHGDHSTVRIAQLPDAGSGVAGKSLEPLRPLVAAALSADPSLDFTVRLSLVREGAGVHRSVSCRVRRYDATVVPRTEGARHYVELDADSAARLGEGVVASLRAEAIPLLQPDTTPTALKQVSRGRWSTDVGLASGAWLVLVYQNDYLRSRPLRITVRGDEGPTAGQAPASIDPIVMAMKQSDRYARRHALERAVSGLGADTTAPGWSTLRSQVSTLGRYPASTFDVVRAVTQNHRVAILSLLDAGLNAPTVWNGFEDLPFLWINVSLADWIAAVSGWVDAIRANLPSGFSVSEIVRDAAPWLFSEQRLAPFLCVLHDALFLLLRDIPMPVDRYVFDKRDPQTRVQATRFLGLRRSELLARHVDQGGKRTVFWPAASPFSEAEIGNELATVREALLSEWGFQDTVLRSPALLAERVTGRPLSCDVLTLRQVRDFDPDWFDETFAFSLSMLLGNRLETKGTPFHE